MKVSIITLFPDSIKGYFEHSMMYKAQDKQLLELEFVDLRQFGLGPRRQVDDTPYGGGDGMLLRVDVVVPAIESVRTPDSRVILMCPTGKTYSQPDAQRLSSAKHLVLVCGHYEGYDERIRSYVDEQISIGDYVLTGGELPAAILIDSIARLIPGVLGGETSAEKESFADGDLLEHPHYTRPLEYGGVEVPKVLRSGHHGEIDAWRTDKKRTK